MSAKQNKTMKPQHKIEQDVMSKINNQEISMKPRWYFLMGSLLMTFGLTVFSLTAVFFTNLIIFIIKKQHLPYLRLHLILENFPWWILLLALMGIIGGVLLLKQYEFSYKKDFVFIVLMFLAVIFIVALIIEALGVNKTLMKRPRTRCLYQRINTPSSVIKNKRPIFILSY